MATAREAIFSSCELLTHLRLWPRMPSPQRGGTRVQLSKPSGLTHKRHRTLSKVRYWTYLLDSRRFLTHNASDKAHELAIFICQKTRQVLYCRNNEWAVWDYARDDPPTKLGPKRATVALVFKRNTQAFVWVGTNSQMYADWKGEREIALQEGELVMQAICALSTLR